jgi:hypothetical protein
MKWNDRNTYLGPTWPGCSSDQPSNIPTYRWTFFRIQDGSKPMSLEIIFYLVPRSRKKASLGTRMVLVSAKCQQRSQNLAPTHARPGHVGPNKVVVVFSGLHLINTSIRSVGTSSNVVLKMLWTAVICLRQLMLHTISVIYVYCVLYNLAISSRINKA